MRQKSDQTSASVVEGEKLDAVARPLMAQHAPTAKPPTSLIVSSYGYVILFQNPLRIIDLCLFAGLAGYNSVVANTWKCSSSPFSNNGFTGNFS